MSQLTKLKQQIDGVAQEAKTTGAALAAFRSKFAGSISQVQATIGGSAQGKDREVVKALQDAQKKVDAAAQALEQAARTARSYGQSL